MSDVHIEQRRKEFTSAEILEMGKTLAHEYATQSRLQDEKKTAMSHYKGLLDESGEKIAKLTQKINNGFEMESIRCDVFFHQPIFGHKQLIACDTGLEVKTVPMTPQERRDHPQTSFTGGLYEIPKVTPRTPDQQPDAQEDYRPEA